MDNLIDFNVSFGETSKSTESIENRQLPTQSSGFGFNVGEGLETNKNNNPFDEIEKKAYFFDDPFENPGIRQTPARQKVKSTGSPENVLISLGENLSIRRSQSLSDEEKIQDANTKKERSHSLELKSKNNELLKLSLLNAQQKRESLSDSPLSKKLATPPRKTSTGSNSDSFEDIMSINPEWVDSSFSKELEQMKIIDIKLEPQTSPPSLNASGILKLSDIKKENLEKVVVKQEKQEAEDESSDENVHKMISNLRQAITQSKNGEAVELLDNLKKVLDSKSGNSSEAHSPNSSTEIQDSNFLTLPIPNPIIRQDTFDIEDVTKDKDQSQNESQMEDSQEESVEPAAIQSNFVEQLSKFLVNSNMSVLHSNPADSSSTVIQPTYIVVVPPPPAPTLNQSQTGRVRRSMSLSLDKKPQSAVEAAKNKRESTLASTPAKTKATSLTRRSSFSTPQQFAKVTRPSLALPGSTRKPNEFRRPPESPVPQRKFGDNSNLPRNNVKRLSFVPKPNDIAEKNLRPKFGGVKKSTGPMKAIAIPQLNYGAKNLDNENVNATAKAGSSRLSIQPNYSSKLMPKSPSLLKRNPRLSFATPQPQSKSNITANPSSADPSRSRGVRSYTAGKKQLLNEF